MTQDLRQTNELCALLSDPTRVRLLALLEVEELTVAELTEVLQLAQSRVSTHLARLRDGGLLGVRRAGAASFYKARPDVDSSARELWVMVKRALEDPLLAADVARAEELVRSRNDERTWAESVAGNMERHYSPGRTTEAALHGVLGFCELGEVLDIASGDGVLAELIARRARAVTCLDASKEVMHAGRKRLGHLDNVSFVHGDMHALPFDDARFDHVMMLNALTYSEDADKALAEAARVLRPGADLVLVTLKKHDNEAAVRPYNHVNLGFEVDELRAMLEHRELDVNLCEVTLREKRSPYFEVVTAYARRRG